MLFGDQAVSFTVSLHEHFSQRDLSLSEVLRVVAGTALAEGVAAVGLETNRT